tara:strand:+ start:4620 stop:4799 length:180 start_codon:yes stop_codon:yes gene_type:complete
VRVGDIVQDHSTKELAIILALWAQEFDEGEPIIWIECLWANGDVEGVDAEDVEVVNESR